MSKPALFEPDPHRKSVIITPEHFQERRGEKKPTYRSINDQFINCYVPGDLPPNVCMGESNNHNHIYVEGITGKDSEVRMRDGFFSARALGENSEVDGGSLIIISDPNLSRRSVNLLNGEMANNGGSTILVVPEEIRHHVFDAMVEEYGYNTPWEWNAERLKRTLAPFKEYGLEFMPALYKADETRSFLKKAGFFGKSPD